MHGGPAKHDRLDAHRLAVRLRGGMPPQASGYPAEMRASRDRLRRRRDFMRQRAALPAPVQETNRQYHRPPIGTKRAYQRDRQGGAQRCAARAVHTRIEVDLALLDSDARRLSELELAIVQTAKQPDANTSSRRQAIPGIGKILALVLRDELHDRQRFPRGPEFVSSCRLGTWATDSAGTPYGPSGTKLGNAYLTRASSDAAGLARRDHPRGQNDLARWEQKHGTGQALTVLAHQLARAVSCMGTREPAFDRRTLLHEYWSGGGEPGASRHPRGLSLGLALGQAGLAAAVNA